MTTCVMPNCPSHYTQSWVSVISRWPSSVYCWYIHRRRQLLSTAHDDCWIVYHTLYCCPNFQSQSLRESSRCNTLIFTHTKAQLFYGYLDSVRDNQGEPVPEATFTHSHLSWSSVIPYCFRHLLRSMAFSLFNLRSWQSFSTISLQVFFDLPLRLASSTSYSIHFFTQSLNSFRSPCPYYRNLFCCSTKIMSCNPSLSQPFTWNSIL